MVGKGQHIASALPPEASAVLHMGLEGSSDGPSLTSEDKDKMHSPCRGHSTRKATASEITAPLMEICHCHFSPAEHSKVTISE